MEVCLYLLFPWYPGNWLVDQVLSPTFCFLVTTGPPRNEGVVLSPPTSTVQSLHVQGLSGQNPHAGVRHYQLAPQWGL